MKRLLWLAFLLPSLLHAGAIGGVTQIIAGTNVTLDPVGGVGVVTVNSAGSGGGGAPTNATYIVQIPNGTLTAAQALSALSTGLLKSTTTTGVLSIASAGTDYQAPITFGTGVLTALGVNVGSAGAPVLFNGAGGTPSSLVLTNATGTPSAITLTNGTGLPLGGITGFGTGIATALAVNTGSAGAPILFNGAGGTPSSIVLTNATGTAASLTAGTATTAITLANTRTIGGSNFNGSANVTSFPAPGAIGGTTPAAGTFTALTGTSVTDSGLTSGRVPYATTAGLLTDSANMTFDGTTLTASGVTGTTVNATNFTFGSSTGSLLSTSGTVSVGTLPYGSGGTGATSFTNHSVVVAGASALSTVAPGASGNVLTSNGTDWTSATPTSGGTVTSVAQSFTGGLISVAGSPITTSGTLALTVAGTSGGIPYFASSSTWASSGALAANALLIGGGAGSSPASTTTGTGVLTALGVNTGSSGAFVVNGGALGTPSSGTGTNITGVPEGGLSLTDITTNNSSTSKHGFLPKLDNNSAHFLDGTGAWSTPAGGGTVTSVAQSFTGGIISVAGSPITGSGTLALTVAGTSGGIPYFSGSTTWATSAALTANAIVIGGGAGTAPSTTTTGSGVLTALGNTANASGGFTTINGTATLTNKSMSADQLTAGALVAGIEEHAISFTVTGGGSVLTTGVQDVIFNAGFSGTLTRWAVTTSPADTITFDILRSADGGAAPSSSIVGGSGTKPNLASGVNGHSTTFTSWTSSTITQYDNFKCQITAVGGTATAATVTLYYR